MAAYPGFIGGSATAQSPAFQNERTVNCYVERGDRTAKTEAALYPRPGFTVFATASSVTGGRALFEENGRCFAVIGDDFVEILADGTVTVRGAVVDDGRPAHITSNGDVGGDLVLASGGTLYRFILATNTFSSIAGTVGQQVDALDGFVFALDRDTSTLHATPAYDGSVFDSSQQRDARPDPWQALKVLDTQVYLFGERSTDIYYNAGTSPFPLAQQTAGAFPFGVAAVDSVAIVGGALAWLGRSAAGIGMVLMARGASVQEISTPALRWAIDGYRRTARIDDAIGEAWEYLGHTFYVLTFPEADATWVYDLTTGTWVEFLTWNVAEGRYHAFRPHWTAVAFGAQLFADRLTGEIHRLDPTSVLDVTGDPIRRLRRPPPLFDGQRRFRVDEIELLVETGLVSSATPPVIVLNYSRDGGKTWAQATAPESVGATGEYRTRVSFPRLGVGREFTPEIVMADAYPYRLVGAEVTLTPGTR